MPWRYVLLSHIILIVSPLILVLIHVVPSASQYRNTINQHSEAISYRVALSRHWTQLCLALWGPKCQTRIASRIINITMSCPTQSHFPGTEPNHSIFLIHLVWSARHDSNKHNQHHNAISYSRHIILTLNSTILVHIYIVACFFSEEAL